MSHVRCATLLAAAALLAAGCMMVKPGGTPGESVAAPDYRVGDRWVYHGIQGYRQKIEWDETHEVTAVGPEGITVKVTLEGPAVRLQRIEKLSAPGIVLQGAVYEDETNRFDPPLQRYRFPLAGGETWDQIVRDLDKPPNPYAPITRRVTVGDYQKIVTPAGTFDAIGLRVVMRLDDETFWRQSTECNDVVWYAPALGAPVREHKYSQWLDKGGHDGMGYHPGHEVKMELVSYTRAR